jgi:hypothetical protein
LTEALAPSGSTEIQGRTEYLFIHLLTKNFILCDAKIRTYNLVFVRTKVTSINVQLKRYQERILSEIQAIREKGEIAPEGTNIVCYWVERDNYEYSYYRLVAKEPIFEGRNGRKTRTQHLGSCNAAETIKAKQAIKRRKQIKALEKLLPHIKQCLCELESIDL